MQLLGKVCTYSFIFFTSLVGNSAFCKAVQGPDKQVITESSFSSLIQLGMENSLDYSSARLEAQVQESNEKSVSRSRIFPQIGLSASYQSLTFDRLKDDGTGKLISNNGQNVSYGVTISYDLQKLFGPEADLAKNAMNNSKIQEKIAVRDLIRNIKKNYFLINQIQNDIVEVNKVIGNFSKIDSILQKQKNIGIKNEIERQQFKVQQSIFDSDRQAKLSDLDSAYFQLATVLNIDVANLKQRLEKIKDKPPGVFSKRSILNPTDFSNREYKEMIDNLSRDYNLSKLEYEKFNSLGLPVVYVKAGRDNPTMASSDGPQNVTEIGITIPIDSFFTRSDQKVLLSGRAEKNRVLFEKVLSEYKNQISLNILNLNRFKSQSESLGQTLVETKKLFEKTFFYYSQKRLDVLGVMDVFQKYLQASRNSLVNEWQIQTVDAELEYLVGGANL